MTQIAPETLQFLRELKENNDRDWFEANKPRYKAANENFIAFVDALIERIAEFDPSVGHHTGKKSVFRIYRDVRFSKDKSPYKTNFGAHVTSAATKSEIHTRAGYYMHLEPGGAFLAGGAYLPQGDWLKSIRAEIDVHGDRFRAIINHPDFKKYYGEIEGEKLKTAPKGYPKDHPEIELLRHKSFLATHQLDDKLITSPRFLEHCGKAFEALKPFDDFLNEA